MLAALSAFTEIIFFLNEPALVLNGLQHNGKVFILLHENKRSNLDSAQRTYKRATQAAEPKNNYVSPRENNIWFNILYSFTHGERIAVHGKSRMKFLAFKMFYGLGSTLRLLWCRSTRNGNIVKSTSLMKKECQAEQPNRKNRFYLFQ